MRSFSLLIFLLISLVSCKQEITGDYVCRPCDLDCDKLFFQKAGTCPHCKMTLMHVSSLIPESELKINNITIENGTGVFLVEGGKDTTKTIKVHYFKSDSFNENSKVLMVLSGAGRNAADYRDAWLEASKKYNLLVLAPEYSETHYPGFWNYNLGGMIYDVDVKNETFKINQNPEHWIYGDFDRIFDLVKSELSLASSKYDMFGHSAGGQVLHRLAIFRPNNKADRILASNSGWYTIPTIINIFPTGIRNIRESFNRLDFNNDLTIFLGENDNASETRGHLRRSPEVDKQGLHRLSRGRYFYSASKAIADSLKKTFNWNLEIVPNIGHDYKKMSEAAAEYLYLQN